MTGPGQGTVPKGAVSMSDPNRLNEQDPDLLNGLQGQYLKGPLRYPILTASMNRILTC